MKGILVSLKEGPCFFPEPQGKIQPNLAQTSLSEAQMKDQRRVIVVIRLMKQFIFQLLLQSSNQYIIFQVGLVKWASILKLID